MATRERRPVEGPTPLPAGTYPATCVSAEATVSAAGNQMVVWEFQVDERPVPPVKRFTMRRGSRAPETRATAEALGLGARFKLSAAVGRRCLLTLEVDGTFNNCVSIAAVR